MAKIKKTNPQQHGADKYTDEVAKFICLQIAEGKGLKELHDTFPDIVPVTTTIHRWLLNNEVFAKHYRRARELQAVLYADQTVALADAADEKNCKAKDLQIRTRQWLASRLFPKVFGQHVIQDSKVEVEHKGSITMEAILNSIDGKTKLTYDPNRSNMKGIGTPVYRNEDDIVKEPGQIFIVESTSEPVESSLARDKPPAKLEGKAPNGDIPEAKSEHKAANGQSKSHEKDTDNE